MQRRPKAVASLGEDILTSGFLGLSGPLGTTLLLEGPLWFLLGGPSCILGFRHGWPPVQVLPSLLQLRTSTKVYQHFVLKAIPVCTKEPWLCRPNEWAWLAVGSTYQFAGSETSALLAWAEGWVMHPPLLRPSRSQSRVGFRVDLDKPETSGCATGGHPIRWRYARFGRRIRHWRDQDLACRLGLIRRKNVPVD